MGAYLTWLSLSTWFPICYVLPNYSIYETLHLITIKTYTMPTGRGSAKIAIKKKKLEEKKIKEANARRLALLRSGKRVKK